MAYFTGSLCPFHFPWFRRSSKIERQQQRINEQIRITPIRVIAHDGSQLGIIPTEEAMDLARRESLDLVEVAPNERPPVCRIMDYGKYKYQQKKRQNRSHSHHAKLKEIRVRPRTGQHDIDVKINQARRFLSHKDKVQVSVLFRGRERAHMEEGKQIVEQIIESLEDVGKVEQQPQRQGWRISCVLAPR